MLWGNISFEDCVDSRSRLQVLYSVIFIYAVQKRSVNCAQEPKSSSWNSPRPFYYSAPLREVFTLQRPAKKMWAENRVNQDTTVYRSTILMIRWSCIATY